jgi:hypothetical protein
MTVPKPPILSKYTAKQLLDLLAEKSESVKIGIYLGEIWFPIGRAQVNLITGGDDEQNAYDFMVGEELKDLGEDESMDEAQRDALSAEFTRLGYAEAPPPAPA